MYKFPHIHIASFPHYTVKRSILLRKKFVKFAWERCETELQLTFFVRSSQMSERQIIYSVCYNFTKKRIPLNNQPHARCVTNFCVTNMSQTFQILHICLQTFRIFSLKIRIVFIVYLNKKVVKLVKI